MLLLIAGITGAASYSAFSQVILGPLPATYSQDFNTLASAGTSSTLPAGWFLAETGSGANITYGTTTGSASAGDTYSTGTTAADRGFGGLQSGSVTPTIGGAFTNNSGSTITDLAISYNGEQWRLGALGRTDRLDFQYSTDATSLTTGTWTNFDLLDFTAPVTAGTIGLLDGNAAANRLAITSTITGLSIASGTTFYIRWTDFNASGADDILAVDDFSITANGVAGATITTDAISGSPFNTTCSSGATVTVPFTSSGTFNAANVYTAQLSNASGSFASPVTIGTLASSSDGSLSINATIPTATTPGTGYRIRVISSNPVVTGSNNGTDLTITYTCSITTNAISGSPFALTCSGGASVNVPFTASSSFSAGNTYTAQLSNSAGSFASPTMIGTLTSTAATGTITATIPSTIAAGTGYRIRVIGSNPSITGSDNGSNLTITYSCSITTGAIAGSPFSISCAAGAAVSVPFTTSSVFATGNVYTAQLSDAAGSFASPVNIGTLSSTATSGSISATIPVSTASGTGYRIRVTGSNPSTTGSDNGTNLTVNYTCSALLINEIYIDATMNDGSPNPNLGEWLELYNGTGSAIDLSCFSICDGDFCVTFPAGSTIAAGGYFTIGSSAGSGCATCDFPGATYNVDWGTCGCTSGSTVGTFTNGAEQVVLYNSSGAIIDAVIWGGGQGLPVTMNTANVGSCSPVSVTLPASGGGAYENIGAPQDGESHERATDGSMSWQMTTSPTLGSTNNPPLPVELISFTGEHTSKGNLISWVTSSEINNAYFELERSFDGNEYTSVVHVAGNGTTNVKHEYDFIDSGTETLSNKCYYRLKQFDFDGKMSTSNIISVIPASTVSFYTLSSDSRLTVILEKAASYKTIIRLTSISGQLMSSFTINEGESTTSAALPAAAGVYFISLETGSDRITRKIIVK